jgi:uncharacterized membrane protein YbhN (UPF0104 family)
VVRAFLDTLDRSDGRRLPTWGAIAVAALLVTAGQIAGARAWLRLHPAAAVPRALATGFHVSQLGKYVPGGFGQAAGQVALSRNAGVTVARAAVAWVVFAGLFIVAGTAIGAVLALTLTTAAPFVRALLGGGILTVLLVNRRLMAWAVGSLRPRVRWLPDPEELPGQADLNRCFAWAVVFVLAHGSAFSILLHSIDADATWTTSMPAFGVALAVGLVAIPVPSGLGVREAVLVALLPLPATAVVSAALIHRLVTIGVEVALASVSAARSAVPARVRPHPEGYENG